MADVVPVGNAVQMEEYSASSLARKQRRRSSFQRKGGKAPPRVHHDLPRRLFQLA